MKINYAILKNAFRAAIQEAVGPMEASQENPLEKKLIDCSPYRFSDALFVVKRFNREGETYKAHESAEEFNARWTVFFADFKNYPRRHAKVPRQQIKYANEIICAINLLGQKLLMECSQRHLIPIWLYAL